MYRMLCVVSIRMTLLSACRRYNDIERAKRIYEHIVEINGGDESAEYCQSAKLLLANIYGSIKQPEKEKQIRLELQKTRGIYYNTLHINPNMHYLHTH